MQQKKIQSASLSLDTIFSSLSSFRFISFVYFLIILMLLVIIVMYVYNTNKNVNDLENALNTVKSGLGLLNKSNLCMDYVNLYNKTVSGDKKVADVTSACKEDTSDYTQPDEFKNPTFKTNCCAST